MAHKARNKAMRGPSSFGQRWSDRRALESKSTPELGDDDSDVTQGSSRRPSTRRTPFELLVVAGMPEHIKIGDLSSDQLDIYFQQQLDKTEWLKMGYPLTDEERNQSLFRNPTSVEIATLWDGLTSLATQYEHLYPSVPTAMLSNFHDWFTTRKQEEIDRDGAPGHYWPGAPTEWMTLARDLTAGGTARHSTDPIIPEQGQPEYHRGSAFAYKSFVPGKQRIGINPNGGIAQCWLVVWEEDLNGYTHQPTYEPSSNFDTNDPQFQKARRSCLLVPAAKQR